MVSVEAALGTLFDARRLANNRDGREFSLKGYENSKTTLLLTRRCRTNKLYAKESYSTQHEYNSFHQSSNLFGGKSDRFQQKAVARQHGLLCWRASMTYAGIEPAIS